MDRLKLWQVATITAIAIVIAVGVIWHSSGAGDKGAPIPAPMSGPPPGMPAIK